MASTLLGVGASVKKNKADLVCCVPSGCQLSSGRDGLGTRWVGCPERVVSEGGDAYCAGAGNQRTADSLGGLLGASIVYIETWGPQETPRARSRGRALSTGSLEVWRGGECLLQKLQGRT